MSKQKSIYIHIPFCKQICPYCDFAKTNKHSEKLYRDYTNALCAEINNIKSQKREDIYTIYFGGGTPSCLPIEYIEQIFQSLHNKFNLLNTWEITFEVNPNTISQDYLYKCKNLGVNRLSIGVQSFDEGLLKKLARGHNTQDIYNLLEMSEKSGFDNISIDLMYGLPGQSLEIWQETLDIACKLNIQHISSYSLIVEENTPYGRLQKNNKLNIPIDDINSQMYSMMCKTLGNNGFDHYEISNYSRNNKYSRHNYMYWQAQDYYGLGVSASGCINNIRYKNTSDINKYIQSPIDTAEKEILTLENQALEELMLALRTKQGINLQQYQEKYNINILKYKKNIINKYKSMGLLEIQEDRLLLTEQGFYLSNEIIVNLT